MICHHICGLSAQIRDHSHKMGKGKLYMLCIRSGFVTKISFKNILIFRAFWILNFSFVYKGQWPVIAMKHGVPVGPYASMLPSPLKCPADPSSCITSCRAVIPNITFFSEDPLSPKLEIIFPAAGLLPH